jgi:hypothetical protein
LSPQDGIVERIEQGKRRSPTGRTGRFDASGYNFGGHDVRTKLRVADPHHHRTNRGRADLDPLENIAEGGRIGASTVDPRKLRSGRGAGDILEVLEATEIHFRGSGGWFQNSNHQPGSILDAEPSGVEIHLESRFLGGDIHGNQCDTNQQPANQWM